MTGYVYIVSNPSFRDGYFKIGKTDNPDVRQRIKALARTGVPEPFEIVAVFACEDSERLEQTLHKAFQDKRVADNKEFFSLDKETINLVRTLLPSNGVDLTQFFEARKDKALPAGSSDEETGTATPSWGIDAAGTNLDRRMTPTGISPETDAAIRLDLQEGSMSLRSIAKKHGVSRHTVKRRQGAGSRGEDRGMELVRKETRRRIPPETDAAIRRDLQERSLSLRGIARKHGVSYHTVKRRQSEKK